MRLVSGTLLFLSYAFASVSVEKVEDKFSSLYSFYKNNCPGLLESETNIKALNSTLRCLVDVTNPSHSICLLSDSILQSICKKKIGYLRTLSLSNENNTFSCPLKIQSWSDQNFEYIIKSLQEKEKCSKLCMKSKFELDQCSVLRNIYEFIENFASDFEKFTVNLNKTNTKQSGVYVQVGSENENIETAPKKNFIEKTANDLYNTKQIQNSNNFVSKIVGDNVSNINLDEKMTDYLDKIKSEHNTDKIENKVIMKNQNIVKVTEDGVEKTEVNEKRNKNNSVIGLGNETKKTIPLSEDKASLKDINYTDLKKTKEQIPQNNREELFETKKVSITKSESTTPIFIDMPKNEDSSMNLEENEAINNEPYTDFDVNSIYGSSPKTKNFDKSNKISSPEEIYLQKISDQNEVYTGKGFFQGEDSHSFFYVLMLFSIVVIGCLAFRNKQKVYRLFSLLNSTNILKLSQI